MPRRNYLWLTLFGLWSILQMFVALGVAQKQRQPVDFLAYQRASVILAQNANPYDPQQSQEIWRAIHQREQRLLQHPDQRPALVAEFDRNQLPGPYIYPPTLAHLINNLHLNGIGFVLLSLCAIIGFALLWIKWSKVSFVWLLLLITGVEVFAMLQAGNIEVILLTCALVGSWALWRGKGWLANPFVAFSILAKPFFGLFFGFFALVLLTQHQHARKTLAITGIGTIVVVGLEFLR